MSIPNAMLNKTPVRENDNNNNKKTVAYHFIEIKIKIFYINCSNKTERETKSA